MQSTKNDVKVKSMLAAVEAKTAALGARPRPTWVTNGLFKFDADHHFNINVMADTAKLASALGFLLQRERCLKDGEAALGLRPATFRWDGYTVAEWESDFKTRVAIIEYEANKKQLDGIKAKLRGLVSDELRTDEELAGIEAALQ